MGFFDSIPGFGMINSFLHPENAYKSAEDAEAEQWAQTQGYLNPTIQAGREQLPRLTGAEDQLFHPEELENKWIQSYSESPYAKSLIDRSRSAGLDAASSMGLNGSSAALGNIQQSAGDIASRDRQSYLDDIMKKYMSAIGIGGDIYGAGNNAATNLAGYSSNYGDTRGGLEYGRSAAPGELFGKIAGGALAGYANSSGFGGGGAGSRPPAYYNNSWTA
jgi:hypothetical protein